MERPLLTGVVLALVLTGCSSVKFVQPLEERSKPRVTVEKGRVQVKPELISFYRDEQNVTIRWQLPPGAGLQFVADGGIVIEGRVTDQTARINDRTPAVILDRDQKEIIKCAVAADGLSASCLNINSQPGVYKYTLRIRERGKDAVLVRDPPIVNME